MSRSKDFIPCVVCGAKAYWSYISGSCNYCDNHVPRGCSCNLVLKKNIEYDSEEAKDSKNYVEPLDEKGRRYPCCEYFIIEEEFHSEPNHVNSGWEAYYIMHPEERAESEEVEHWEHKLGLDDY